MVQSITTDSGGADPTWEVLDNHEATSTESTYEYVPSPALDLDEKYSHIIVIWKGKNNDGIINQLKVNSETEYHTTLTQNILGTITGIHNGSATQADLFSTSINNVARAFYFYINISRPLNNATSNNVIYTGFGNSPTRALVSFAGGTQAGSGTTITSIEVKVSSSTWVAGTTVRIYGVLQ